MNLIATASATNARAQLIERLWLNTQISREQIFGSADRLPHAARSDARDMWAGYVGPKYRPGGLVLVAHYPAGGTVPYANTARAARDKTFYELISAFKRADSVSRAAAFEALNRHVARAVPQWRMYTIIRVVLEAAGLSLDDVALINLVPYRIAENISPSAKVVKASWTKCTEPALHALQPGMVAALGIASGRALAARRVAPLYVFRRTNGDTYVHPEAYEEVARLRAAARGAPIPARDAARKPQASLAISRTRSRATAQRGDIETARFRLGPNAPSATSVHGIIRAVVARRPGLSGAELLAQLRATDFSATVSPHTANGTPEDAWFIGHIRGGLRRGFLEMA